MTMQRLRSLPIGSYLQSQQRICMRVAAFSQFRRALRALLLLVLGTIGVVSVLAATPELSGYRHASWTSDNSVLSSAHNLGQDKDGYLWVSGPQGMYRFDGVQFQSIESLSAGKLKAADIMNWTSSTQGGLWIMSAAKGLLRWKDGQITALGVTNCTPQTRDPAMVESHDGGLWIRTYAGLFRYHDSHCARVGEESGLTGHTQEGIFLDKDETLWVKSDSGDLFFLRKGSKNFEKNLFGAGKATSRAVIGQGPSGDVWLSDEVGLRRVSPGSAGARVGKDSLLPANTVGGTFFFDRDGSLWILTKAGVRHIKTPASLGSAGKPGTQPEEELFTPSGGLTSDAVWDLFQDREGSIWVATDGGLDRLTANPILQLALPKARDHQYALLPGDGNSVWTGNWDVPLMLASSHHVEVYKQLPNSVDGVHRDRNGGLWFSGGEKGELWHRTGAKMELVKAPTTGDNPARDVAVDKESAVWLSLIQGGIYRFADHTWTREDQVLGIPSGTPCTLIADPEGRIWVAWLAKLVLWNKGTVSTFSSEEGLGLGFSDTLSFKDDHLWMGGRAGAGIFLAGKFHKLSPREQDVFGRVMGILESESGDLWINGAAGAFQISAPELQRWLRDPTRLVSYRKFNGAEGLYGTAGQRYPAPTLAQGNDGRIWFSTNKGVFWTDAARLSALHNTLVPPVTIESVNVEERNAVPVPGMRLPARSPALGLHYAALSMADPAKVSYRYKLDGLDRDWQDAEGRREAFYTNLAPGSYTFHVIASNNDGVWNEVGASLVFAVSPRYYQTVWFRLLCFVALGLLIALVFKLRLQRATTVVSERLAAQMAERERIARELHDTLLQSFYGVILSIQTAADQAPLSDSSRALFEDALQSAERSVNEGRERVRGLRGEAEFLELNEELASVTRDYVTAAGPVLAIDVAGAPRTFHPLVREEVSRVGREAIANAYKHSGAKTINVRLTYDAHWFRLSIEDDGSGIAAAILEAGGRADHYGLKGMRERSRNIGAKYRLRSESGKGTLVEIVIAAKVAYTPLVPALQSWMTRSKPATKLSHVS